MGDVLLHAGDFSKMGTEKEFIDFNAWLGTLPHKFRVVIPGNHDFLAQTHLNLARELLSNATHFLVHEACEIDGLKIFGSPWTPYFGGWAFNYKADEAVDLWRDLPDDTDILMTHGPAYSVLDRTDRGVLAGCPELLRIVGKIRPRYHVCGHIHEAHGFNEAAHTASINASMLNLQYRYVNKPFVFDL